MSFRDHTYTPGISGNKSGRPRGFAGVAALIMRATNDGEELVNWALDVWRNLEGQRTHAERTAAHAWLADRGLGKAIAQIELSAMVGPMPEDVALDDQLDGLSDEELAVVAKLGLARPAGPAAFELPAPAAAAELDPEQATADPELAQDDAP